MNIDSSHSNSPSRRAQRRRLEAVDSVGVPGAVSTAAQAWIALLALACSDVSVEQQGTPAAAALGLTRQALSDDPSHAFPLTAAVWEEPRIPVCWENAAADDATERWWVQEAVERSWEAASAVNFVGWGACAGGSRGVRVRIEDSGPRTKALGSHLDGHVNGMLLNFTFANWSESCQSSREHCIRVIAVHEFGHALGFAHEQNRPDTPNWCDEEQGHHGDAVIGPWDIDSVMNYCNPDWNGNGTLSVVDGIAARQLYGNPPEHSALAMLPGIISVVIH